MHELFKYVVRGKWGEVGEGKCMCSKEQDNQEFNENGVVPHGFGDWYRKICLSSSGRSVMSYRVLKNADVCVCHGFYCGQLCKCIEDETHTHTHTHTHITNALSISSLSPHSPPSLSLSLSLSLSHTHTHNAHDSFCGMDCRRRADVSRFYYSVYLLY
jgi:hypothetical protein